MQFAVPHDRDVLRRARASAEAFRPSELDTLVGSFFNSGVRAHALEVGYAVLKELARRVAQSAGNETVILEHVVLPETYGACAMIVRVKSLSWRLTGETEAQALLRAIRHLTRAGSRPRARGREPHADPLGDRAELAVRLLEAFHASSLARAAAIHH